MSEYQYYEFLTIDRSLTSEEMAALRSISTRAHITPVSFTNEYNWGNLKANPSDLMRRFFDAHVYVANWMTGVFMVRLPIEALSRETAEAMAAGYVLDLEASETHWVITWCLEESDNYDRFGMEDGSGWMARLSPVRDELLRGDIRSLYIGWLASVTFEMTDDEDTEPLFVEGLGSLTPAQKALAEFLEVDPDLLAGAGMGSPDLPEETLSEKAVDDWIARLPSAEVNALLKQLLEGKGREAERTIRNRYAAWRRGFSGEERTETLRTVGELWQNAEEAKKKRRYGEKREQEKRKLERRRAREVYLQSLAADFPKAWKKVHQTVERGSGLAYDEGRDKLIDLFDAYSAHSTRQAFHREMREFITRNSRRKALIQRLVKAGIWKEK